MKKALKIILIVIAAILVLALALLFVLTRDWKSERVDIETDNPYITPLNQPLVSAHRSGGDLFPENTLMAFKGCIESESFKTDIFEFDLHITKDGQLIILHDSTLDRTSDACEVFGTTEIYPENYTLEELKQINLGENFTDINGNTPYKGLRGKDVPDELHVSTLNEVFDYLTANGDFGYIIEIKNAGELGFKAADKLYETLKEYDLLDKAIIGTFNGDVTKYMDDTYPDMLRSAGIVEVLKFYFSSLFNVNHKEGYFKFKALQIPANQFVIHLGTTRICTYAHQNGIAVQYWTINEPEDVAALAYVGADCIMSDNPEMAYDVINGK